MKIETNALNSFDSYILDKIISDYEEYHSKYFQKSSKNLQNLKQIKNTSYSQNQLLEFGLSQQIIDTNFENALDFKFSIDSIDRETLMKFTINNCSNLQEIFKNGIGWQEFFNSFKSFFQGEQSQKLFKSIPKRKQLTKEWFQKHYRLIIWKQSSSLKLNPQSQTKFINPINILNHLIYHYLVEIELEKKSPLTQLILNAKNFKTFPSLTLSIASINHIPFSKKFKSQISQNQKLPSLNFEAKNNVQPDQLINGKNLIHSFPKQFPLLQNMTPTHPSQNSQGNLLPKSLPNLSTKNLLSLNNLPSTPNIKPKNGFPIKQLTLNSPMTLNNDLPKINSVSKIENQKNLNQLNPLTLNTKITPSSPTKSSQSNGIKSLTTFSQSSQSPIISSQNSLSQSPLKLPINALNPINIKQQPLTLPPQNLSLKFNNNLNENMNNVDLSTNLTLKNNLNFNNNNNNNMNLNNLNNLFKNNSNNLKTPQKLNQLLPNSLNKNSITNNKINLTSSETKLKNENDFAKITLTDGWDTIKATLDSKLTELIQNGKMFIGQNIRIGTFNKSKKENGIELNYNSTRRSLATNKLGFEKKPLLITIHSIKEDCGLIPAIEIIIQRKYPSFQINNENDKFFQIKVNDCISHYFKGKPKYSRQAIITIKHSISSFLNEIEEGKRFLVTNLIPENHLQIKNNEISKELIYLSTTSSTEFKQKPEQEFLHLFQKRKLMKLKDIISNYNQKVSKEFDFVGICVFISKNDIQKTNELFLCDESIQALLKIEISQDFQLETSSHSFSFENSNYFILHLQNCSIKFFDQTNQLIILNQNETKFLQKIPTKEQISEIEKLFTKEFEKNHIQNLIEKAKQIQKKI
ncbi:hypothetical protein M0811_10926 [Anaeramoeba ignava]|uniref:Uncharacterized protein n=1 Tax=Anaeramoeba ignava TaxID=1746090 RepID=A0A9Q0R980_ANAIG|nr:hypothetical protein M0811_10926 [Anaeramoeba ignava]